MFVYEIINEIHDAHRGICERLAEKTLKAKQWWASHGAEPKTINPASHGSKSPADHYVEFVELYEQAKTGAGKDLNERIYFELRHRLRDGECESDAYDCLIKNLNATTELSTGLADALRDGKLDRNEIREIRAKLPEITKLIEKNYAMLDFHEGLLESYEAKTQLSAAKIRTNGSKSHQAGVQ